jgi:hypothetical protein
MQPAITARDEIGKDRLAGRDEARRKPSARHGGSAGGWMFIRFSGESLKLRNSSFVGPGISNLLKAHI